MQKIALYRKYRPDNFDQAIGQEHIVKVLKNAVKDGKISHAYLFSGPRGTGKTSLARILARVANCESPKDSNPCGKCQNCKNSESSQAMDLIEIDAASNRGIDEIRDLREKVKFAPSEGMYKVYIIDEAHMLTDPAFNALLKTLEEPPAHAIFILATTEVHKIPATIISRCQRHDFKRIKTNDIVNLLAKVAKKEGFNISSEALEVIAEASEGGLRDALSLLDQLSSVGLEQITEPDVENLLGLAPHKTIEDFVIALLEYDSKKSLGIIKKAEIAGNDLIILTRNSLELVRKILLAKLAGIDNIEGTKELIARIEEVNKKAEESQIINVSDLLMSAQNLFKTGVDPKAVLVVVCAKRSASQPQDSMVQTTKKTGAPTKIMPVEQAATAAAPVAGTTKSLNGKWQHFLMEVKSKNNTIHAFLRVAEPNFVGEELVLTFPYKFHKERLEETKNKKFVEETLSKIYGSTITVSCKLEGNGAHKNNVVTDVDSAASILGGELVE
jgi:DNA polymerase-3 subunit gamma/tau